MKLPSPVLQCAAHHATAGWQCTFCHQPLCPDCAATKVTYPTTVVACTLCGNFAEVLVRHRTETQSLAQRLPAAFSFPFTVEGGAAWLGLALWVWLTSFAGVGGFVFGWGGVVAALLGLTRSTARGNDHLELTDFSDPLISLAVPVARFSLAMIPAWGGALLAGYLHSNALLVASLVLTVVWSPTAFIGAATNANLVHMLNPFRVLRVSAAMGKDFGVYAAGLGAVLLTTLVLVPVGFLVNQVLWVPVVSGVLTRALWLYGPFVGARIAGVVLHLYGPLFGWGDAVESYEPVLPGVEPRGVVPEVERPKAARAPIELPELPAPVLPNADVKDRFSALELDAASPAPEAVLDVSLLPSLGEQHVQGLREAIARNDLVSALDTFRATGLSLAPLLRFDELVWVGQAASSALELDAAVLALRQAVSLPDVAPAAMARARVLLGRLLAERMQQPAEGRAWMEAVVRDAPGTPAATFAAQWLAQRPAP